MELIFCDDDEVLLTKLPCPSASLLESANCPIEAYRTTNMAGVQYSMARASDIINEMDNDLSHLNNLR